MKHPQRRNPSQLNLPLNPEAPLEIDEARKEELITALSELLLEALDGDASHRENKGERNNES